MSETDYAELLAFIRGEGRWHFLGGGITTHPEGREEGHQMHEACLELERRGQIKRRTCSTEEAVTWVDVNKPDFVEEPGVLDP